MKKVISAILALLILATSAAAAPAGPPKAPRGGGPAPGRAPRIPPRPGVPRPMRPHPGVHRPMHPMPPRPGVHRLPHPMPPRPGVHRPPHPMPPRPGIHRPLHPVPPHPPFRHHRFRFRHHHLHDGWFFGGLGIGLLIGAIENNRTNNDTDNSEYRAEDVRSAARETAEQQSGRLLDAISRAGSLDALLEMNDYWRSQGQITLLDTSGPMLSLKVSGFREDLTILYLLDSAAGEVSVTVSFPAYGVTESVTALYREPETAAGTGKTALGAAAPQAPPKPAPRQERPDAFERLGFTLEENMRTKEGFLVARSVAQGSSAEKAGMETGAVIRAIDGNSTARVSVEQVRAFIDRRAEAGASVKITFTAGGQEKTVTTRL